MALKLPVSFPIFAPPSPQNTLPCPYPPARRPTEIRFSRWINPKSEKFSEQHRSQKEIGDDIRRNRRFDSADTSIGRNHNENFRSQGTPSSSSIPWKKSKYSKRKTSKNLIPPRINPIEKEANVTLSEDGISYVIDGAPFEFKYSYTETPKVKPLKLREPYAPFGPTTMHRPWTGCAPLPPSQKKLKEFDSFVLPPPNKKGVKPVQNPGPFLPGSGPRYVKSREEILGEPLKVEEVRELIKSCLKSERQLNMGRDGLTHNMLDNIHAHWKRRRVCKIKCKGVCTVDMDNVCKQLEERTGGKVIYRRGGVLYLFRGRNYNYKNRPRFPLMLWKPAAPVYPRLIERTPEGLTLEEATEMRRKGRELMPICKLAKNGVYSDLVSNVREAFEVCELVRIDCQGIKGSDYHKIGAKLKDLVPCVLISFEGEHILIWRGRDWKSPLPRPEINSHLQEESNDDSITSVNYSELGVPEASTLTVPNTSVEIGEQYAVINENSVSIKTNEVSFSDDEPKGLETSYGGDTDFADAGLEAMSDNLEIEKILDVTASTNKEPAAQPLESATIAAMAKNMQRTKKVSLLLKQAVESGSAIVLDDHTLDADKIFESAVAFAQSAPRGPVFSCQPRKTAINNSEKQETGDSEVKKFTPVSRSRGNDKQNSRTQRRKDTEERYLDAVPKGTLRVDELAKLLA